MRQRFLSGLVIFFILIITTLIYQPSFYLLAIFVATISLAEWYNITKSSLCYSLLGLLIILVPIISLLIIADTYSRWLLFSYFMVISTVDIMAMFGGKLIGGPKLAPVLSPNKTISGFVIGISSAALVPFMFNLLKIYIPEYDVFVLFDLTIIRLSLYCIILGSLAQMSDLFISIFKRKFKVKDSGSIIPGHGGMLDRCDSIILTAPALLIYLHLNYF